MNRETDSIEVFSCARPERVEGYPRVLEDAVQHVQGERRWINIPFLNKLSISIILGLRPLFGIAHCRYPVSCTKFAIWQLQEKSLFAAICGICKRIISCNPLW